MYCRFSFSQSQWCTVALVVLLSAAAHAQAPEKTLTTYYDSARTQRHTVYQVQLRGPRPDTVAHGPFRRFARTGSLEELGHFSSGQPDSVWTRYYPPAPGQPATVARRLPMQAGQPDGPFIVYHPDGRVAQRGTFRQGRLVDSLVTIHKAGRPRLLARFDSSSVPGLRGSFQQWRGAYTAHQLSRSWLEAQGAPMSDSNHYPNRDPARYWTGQLAAGRLVGAYTEYDADGEPRLRLSYTMQGGWYLTTLYYPAAWLRYELQREWHIPADSVVHSLPFYQWQAAGPQSYLTQRYWDCQAGLAFGLPEVQVFRIVPARRRFIASGDVVGVVGRPTGLAGLSATAAAAFEHLPAYQRIRYCNGPYAVNGQVLRYPGADKAAVAHFPALKPRQPVALQLVRRPARRVLAAADTTDAYYFRPLARGETALPGGRRLVQRPFVTRIYSSGGQLEEVTHIRWFGRKLVRGYYPTGQRLSTSRIGWLATYKRYWEINPSRSYNRLTRLLGMRMVRPRRPLLRIGKLEVNIGFLPAFRKPRHITFR